MNKKGEIIIVEDDVDDQELLVQALQDAGVTNELTVFANGAEAYTYLNNNNKDPFLILSDINMPLMTGIELRDVMQKEGELRLRSIPFLFMTTGTASENLIYAYTNSVQGFFQKPPNYKTLVATIKAIINYWQTCTEPVFH